MCSSEQDTPVREKAFNCRSTKACIRANSHFEEHSWVSETARPGLGYIDTNPNKDGDMLQNDTAFLSLGLNENVSPVKTLSLDRVHT